MAFAFAHSQAVLPNPEALVLERVERVGEQFRLYVVTNQRPACPICGCVSRSRHSCYCRRLQDLPWQGMSVQLCVFVHRYRCRNPACPRKVFCERLPGVARCYARQTDRASEIVRIVGYVSGGRPGQRLLLRLAIETSDDTVLRRVKQKFVEPAEANTIKHLGVDDWAWRKGQNYGTILVDLDLHRVVDLLPDRSTESFAAWLRQYSNITAIARDRCGIYADGATLGAPDAQQVADRFHLVLNLSAAVERVFEERSRELVLPPDNNEDVLPALQECCVADSHAEPSTASETLKQQRRQRRLDRYEEVVDLYKQGYSQRFISNQLGIGRKTIRRWLRVGEFPERKQPHRRPAKVTVFGEYLQCRWNEGCHNATRLYQEIRERGYTGKRSMVAKFMSAWRATGNSKIPTAPERIAPKHAAILATRPTDQMTGEQQKLFDRIIANCPDALVLRGYALEFREALASCEAWRMMAWVDSVKYSRFGPLVRFAYGLQKDASAVNAAVETDYSTGQVEGQINRLKMIKREMYGRAGFQLLRARVLPYTSSLYPFGRAP